MQGDRQHRPGDSGKVVSDTGRFPKVACIRLRDKREERRGEERRAFACVKFVMLMSIVSRRRL